MSPPRTGDLDAIAASVVAGARPGEEVEAVVARSVRTTVRVHDAEVESLETAESAGIGVRVVADHREGFAHAGTLDGAVVDSLLAEARDNAGFAVPDDRVALARPDGVAAPDLDLYRPALAATPTETKIAMALELEAAVRAADPRVRGVRTSIYADGRSQRAVATSTGIEAAVESTGTSLSTNAMIDDLDGSTRTGSAHEAGREPAEVDPARVASLAVERGLRLLGARAPTAGRVTVVLEPRFTSTLFAVVAGMLSGERVFKRRTPFAERLGDTVAPAELELVEDPCDAESLGAVSVDGEGLASRPVPLITAGTVAGFLHDTRSGRGLGQPSTASARRGARATPRPGHRALHLGAGHGDLESLVASVGDGLLVQSFQGLNSGVNAVSGDLSVGVEGIRIRDGVLAEPVREATLAGAVLRLLADVRAIGADRERLPSGNHMPSMAIDGLTLSGSAGS